LDRQPVWSPDGLTLAFSSNRVGGAVNLFQQAADGSGGAKQLTDTLSQTYPTSFLPDGSGLLFWEGSADTGPDVSVLSLNGDTRSEVLVATPFVDRNAEVSPDGRWLAYQSNESGRYEVYVVPFPDVGSGGRWQVTTEGGTRPTWSPHGNELFYVADPGRMMVVTVESGTTFSHGSPRMLFEDRFNTTLLSRHYDVSPDGERFLIIGDDRPTTGEAVPQPVLARNWFQELTERVPVP
jgi:Tol biopolymer transport system component